MRTTIQRIVVGAAIVSVGLLTPMRSPDARATATAAASILTSSSVARIAQEMTDPNVPASAVSMPADFQAVMGYRPEIVELDGRAELVKPTGSCSSPLGATKYDFNIACMQHDLGYDLLRYATAVHAPLGAWARQAIDRDFAHAVRAHCAATTTGLGRIGCDLTGDLYAGVVELNSWRQAYGSPGHEPAMRLVLIGAGGLALVGFAIATRASARRSRATRRKGASSISLA